MTTVSEERREVSVIGLGAMGAALARTLLRNGYHVTVWNRTRARAEALIQEGAVLAPRAADAISASPVVLICVTDYKATNAILNAEEVASALAGRVLVQLTTGAPQEARESEAWAQGHGAEYLDGAIQATPDQMGRPDAMLLLSGKESTFQRVEPLLSLLGGDLEYLGEQVGSASAMDLATLSSLYGTILGFFHGALLCESEGFAVDKYGAIMARVSPAFGEFLQHEANVIQSGDYAVTQSPLNISVEATERIVQVSQAAGIGAELPALAAGLLKKAAAAGYANEELAAAIKVLRPLVAQAAH